MEEGSGRQHGHWQVSGILGYSLSFWVILEEGSGCQHGQLAIGRFNIPLILGNSGLFLVVLVYFGLFWVYFGLF